MTKLTQDEINTFDRTCIENPPLDFADLSPAERRSWVQQELLNGDYQKEKALEIVDVIYFGVGRSPWDPEYVLFLILLEAFDPAEVEAVITKIYSAKFFLDAYGLERSKPFISSEIWLKALARPVFYQEEKKTRNEVKLLLESRGAEQIGPLIKDKATGDLFIEIFGLKALSLLPKEQARQVKGRHLEDELGL